VVTGGILTGFDSILFAGGRLLLAFDSPAWGSGAMKRVICWEPPVPIGVQALKVSRAVRTCGVVGLSCDRNVRLLLEEATSLGVRDRRGRR